MSERILIGKADVTEHVAAMFDAIVGSMDWGSHFLDVETIESILIVGELAGFDCPAPESSGCNPPGFSGWPGGTREDYEEFKRKIAESLVAWRAQIKAKARAMAGGEP